MALSPRLQWQKIGFLKSTGIFSPYSFFSAFFSSTNTGKSAHSKKSEAAKEQRTTAVESFVKKYIQMHPGVFPKATRVQNEVGGSWYLLKDIIKELKEKMLSSFQIQKRRPSEKSDVMVDTAASKARITGKSLDSADINQLKSRVQPSEGVTQPLPEKDTLSTLAHVTEEKSSGAIVKSDDPADCVKLVESGDGGEFETNSSAIFAHILEEKSSRAIIKSEDPADHVKLVESGDIGEFETDSSTVFVRLTEEKFSRAIIKSEYPAVFVNESGDVGEFETNSTTVCAHVTEKKSSGAIIKSEDSSNCVKLVESRDGDDVEANSSTAFDSDRDDKAASMLLSFLKQVLESAENKETTALAPLGEVTSVENGENSSKKKVRTSLAPNGTSKTNDIHSSYYGAVRLADLFMKQKRHPSETHETPSDFLKDSSGDVTMKDDIKGLIDRIKVLNVETPDIRSRDHIISENTNQLKNGGLQNDKSITSHILETLKISDIQKQQKSLSEPYRPGMLKKHIQDKIQKMEKKEIYLPQWIQEKDKDTLTKKDDSFNCNGTNLLDVNEKNPTEPAPFEAFSSETLSYSDTESRSDEEAFDFIKPEPSPKSPHPNNRAPQKRDINPFLFTEKGRKDQTNLLVRFLRKSVNATEIRGAFKRCGPIGEIRFIPSKKESKFKDAYICFKTKEGLQRALAKTDVVVSDADVALSSPDPSMKTANKILVPELVGDPEVPIALLENPTRTVVLKSLPRDLASHHLREAFSFCGGEISGFYIGSSASVAYLEFETEDAKEKALAKASVIVSEKQISVLRIDTPITTVVRITNMMTETKESDVHATCSLHGQVKRLIRRGHDTFDVQFKVAEWPNMVKILNSLNGLVVNNRKWIAQPATVIPVEILQAIWSQQEGRRQVCSLMRNLCQKLGESSIDIPELNRLMDQYYMEST